MNGIKIPFNLYDFLGYIVQGFLLAIGFILLFIPTETVNRFIDLHNIYTSSFIILLISYIIGHITAEIGSFILENTYVKKIKGYPQILESNKPFKEEFKRVFDAYFENRFEIGDARNSFLLAFHTVKENCPVTYSRIFTFLVNYGFARNLCMVFEIYAILFLIKFVFDINSLYLAGFVVSVALSYVFFRRYYKFLSHHNSEVYYSFYLYAKNR